MAAALVKVIRGGRSGAYSQLPAIGRGILEEGVLPHLGSARAAPAAGMGRLMHTGQWRNSGHIGGAGSKLAEQKSLLFGMRGALSPNQKPPRMALFSGKRFMSDGPFGSPPGLPWVPLWCACGVSLYYILPSSFSGLKKLLGYEE